MLDVWRVHHPKTQDYTFYSPVHRSYSRIEYIMVEHRLLDFVIKTTLSDYSPVTMKMKILGSQNRPKSWRLNEELIQHKETEDKIKKELEQYFERNDTKEISEATLWEAHKAYIRGFLIAIGTREKKGKDKEYGKIIKKNP